MASRAAPDSDRLEAAVQLMREALARWREQRESEEQTKGRRP